MKLYFIVVILVVYNFISTSAILRRCYQCRSRGEMGSCKDPFHFNATDVEHEPGLSTIPCASGWCGKLIEGGGTYAVDDFDQATQRMCVQRGPDDNQDRCAHTVFNYKKVYMCFCQGDLCNGSLNMKHSSTISATTITALFPLIVMRKVF